MKPASSIGLVSILLASALLGLFGCDDSSEPTPPPGEEGLPLGTTLQGRHFTCSDFQGKVLLVCFWTTWCGASRSAIADLDSVWNDLGPSGQVALVASALDTSEGALETYLETHSHDFIITQGGAEEMAAFEIRAVPTFFVLDAQGNPAWHALGYPLPDSLEDVVHALLNQ